MMMMRPGVLREKNCIAIDVSPITLAFCDNLFSFMARLHGQANETLARGSQKSLNAISLIIHH